MVEHFEYKRMPQTMRHGYYIGVGLRFVGFIFLYLAYLAAPGLLFDEKIRTMAAQQQMWMFSYMLVGSMLSLFFAVIQVKKLRLLDNQNDNLPPMSASSLTLKRSQGKDIAAALRDKRVEDIYALK
eukprot:TRINITY_DN1920_c0_g1_i1.p1 TRINITY_DN1920_c0_g1~~TRINITY_DN1920_c0_g1_i1.p1  ORF type:complete len:126 (+),score=34.12 TRINITY_DN1920_c0_g1_i1:11-388(+)